jgi:hypothetical protein
MATRKKASLAIELDDLGRPARPRRPAYFWRWAFVILAAG